MARDLRGRHARLHVDLDLRWTVPALVVFAALRLLTVVGRRPAVGNDTPSYLEIEWWRGVRLPTVPIAFWLAGRDVDIIVWLQLVAASTMWAAAAVALVRLIGDRSVSRALLAFLLALGATRPVAGWDLTIQSESLSIGLWIALFAVTLHLVARPTRSRVIGWMVLAVLWLFCRQAHAYQLVLLVPGMLLVAARHRDERRLWVAMAAGVALLSFVGVADSSNPALSRSSLSRIVCDRMIGNDSRIAWFREHGMPVLPRPAQEPTDRQCFRVLESDREFRLWLEGPGYSTYTDFVVSHPGYIAPALVERGSVVGVATGPDVSAARQVIPKALESLLWPRGTIGGVAFAMAIGVVGAGSVIVARRRSVSTVQVCCLYAMTMVPPTVIIVWVGLPPPIQRQLVLAALQLRVALAVFVAVAAEKILNSRASRDGRRRVEMGPGAT